MTISELFEFLTESVQFFLEGGEVNGGQCVFYGINYSLRQFLKCNTREGFFKKAALIQGADVRIRLGIWTGPAPGACPFGSDLINLGLG